MSAAITVSFDEQGNPTVSVNGASGRDCLELSRPVEQALGLSDVKRTETRDMRLRKGTATNARTR